MSDVLSIKTTTVKYRPKPQAAVQYEIALLSGTLVYNPNDNTGRVKGALQWQVYKIEGDKRTRMPNNVAGMKCYCGYSDNPSSESPSSEAGTNATDNVTFNDNGKAEVDYNSRTTKQFTIVYGSVTDGVFTQLARLGVPVNVAGKDSTPTLSIHLDNQYDAILCYYHNGEAKLYGSRPVTNVKVMYGGEDVTDNLQGDVTVTANSVPFEGGHWLTQNKQYMVDSISATTVIAFSVTYKGQTATAAMTIRLQDGGNKYNIRPSVSTIVHNTSTDSLSVGGVNIEVWMENETGSSLLASIPSDMNLTYTIYTKRGADTVYMTEDYNNGYRIIEVDIAVEKIVITLTNSQNVVLDTQTILVIKVKNGNDAPQLQFLSPSCIVRLSNNTYGTPVVTSSNKASFYLGSNIMTDTIFWFTEKDEAHKIPKSDPTNPTDPKTLSFNGWTFDVSNSNGILTFTLVSVDSGAAETISLPIYAQSNYAAHYGSGEAHNNVSYAIARKGEDGESAVSIDFDNNNATLLYNSSKSAYVNAPVAKVSVFVGGENKSNTATITFKSHDVNGAITRDGVTKTISNGAEVTSPNGTGIISVKATSLAEGKSFGYITATYTDSFGIGHTATFNVTRSVGRYAVEIIATPTQISYNQTTGIASSSKVVAKINAIDIDGKKTDGAAFSTFGAMKWRYIGATDWTTYAPDPNSGQSASVLEIKNLDFTKSGVEFSFVDGSRNQLDYETVPFSSVSNGGDAYLVNAASMNIALTLSQISYGTPLGDVPNVIYMTKNNVVVETDIKYKLPGSNATIDDSHPTAEVTYNSWVFNYKFSEGKLNINLKRVGKDAPTSMQLPVEVIYGTGTDSITRIIYVSYTAIQKGPAGRSYKPNTPVLFEEGKEYKWDDEYRDFIYYAFKVNDKGEQDDEKGALSYFMYGVKEYGMTKVKTPPSLKGGDDNWEYVSEYKSIIVNCLFGTNAIIGGFRMSGGVQESVCTSEDERIAYDENGNEIIENGEVVKETYQKPLIIIDGNEGVIEIFKKKAGMRIGLDGDGNPCIMGYNTNGKLVWKLGTEVVTNPTDNVNIQIPSGSTTASAFVSGNTLTISVRGKWLVTNNSNNSILIEKDKLGGTFEGPFIGELSVPGDISIESGVTKEIIFSGSNFNTYDEGYLPPFDYFRIKVTAKYGTEAKAQSYVVAGVPKPNDPIIHY